MKLKLKKFDSTKYDISNIKYKQNCKLYLYTVKSYLIKFHRFTSTNVWFQTIQLKFKNMLEQTAKNVLNFLIDVYFTNIGIKYMK